MKKNTHEEQIPIKELGIQFNDGKVFELDQKFLNGEITFEEYCQTIKNR